MSSKWARKMAKEQGIHIFFSTRHETWTLSQNNSSHTEKKQKERQWSHTAKLKYYLRTTILGITGPRLQYLVQPHLEPNWKFKYPHPCTLVPLLFKRNLSHDNFIIIWNAFTSTKAYPEIFSNHIVKKYFNIMLTKHIFTQTWYFSRCCIFSTNIPFDSIKNALPYRDLDSFSIIFFQDCISKEYLSTRML